MRLKQTEGGDEAVMDEKQVRGGKGKEQRKDTRRRG